MRRTKQRLHRVVTRLALVATAGAMFQTAGCGVVSSGSAAGCESGPSTSDTDARYLLVTRVEDADSDGHAWQLISSNGEGVDADSNGLAWQWGTSEEVDKLSPEDRQLVTSDPFVANPVNVNSNAEFIADVAEDRGITRTNIPWLVDPDNLFFYWEPTEADGDTDDGSTEAVNGHWVIVRAADLNDIPDDLRCTLVDANGDPAADKMFPADTDFLSEVIISGFLNMLITDYVQDQLGVASTFSF